MPDESRPRVLAAGVFAARALYVAERIDLQSLDSGPVVARGPLAVTAGAAGLAIVFRYGSVVLFNLGPGEEGAFLASLALSVHGPVEPRLAEELEIRIDPDGQERLEGPVLFLPAAGTEHLQLIAEVLAQAVMLDYYESLAAQNFDRVEPIAARLSRRGGSARPRELLRHIGEVLTHQATMVGRAQLSENPDVLWDHPGLQRLFARLADEFELKERREALEKKLELISRTAETALDVLQTRRGLRVEWYIVILIVVEVLLTLYEMFVRH